MLRFPHSFQIYYKSTKVKTTIFHLGEEQASPLYTAALHVGWYGKSDVTLYLGATADGPILGTAHNTRGVGYDTTVNINSPPLPKAVSEKLTVKFHLGGGSYSFVALAGIGADAYPEKFEWRQSRSKEVTGDNKTFSGWKLVRLDANRATSMIPATQDEEAVTAGDGGEVVAISIDTTRLGSKVAQFKFLGTGATGVLGDTWAIMAVMTALRIWQMRWFLASA